MRIALRGTHFHYEEKGTGDPLLLIHAFPLDHSLWADQIDFLSRTHRVLAPDLRGFGRSGDAPETVSMDDYAADLAALLDALNLDQVVLCGLSMGGYISLAFLEHYADRARAVILCNTRSAADSAEARKGRLETADKTAKNGMAELTESMLPRMLSPEGLARTELKVRVRSMMARQRGSGAAAALRGMAARPDRTPVLAALKIPALVISGDKDVLIPEAECRAMAETIPGGHYVLIPGAGHLSNLEYPVEFNAAVRSFLQGLFQS